MNILGREALAYIAGIVDGEGCIGISKNGYLRVTVSNGSKVLLGWMNEATGIGSLCRYQPQGNRKEAGQWRCFGHDARALLVAILPYLIVKAPQASVALGSDERRRELMMRLNARGQAAATGRGGLSR